MSKINAIRFINVNYNNNTIRINDECMYFRGANTLISLENGGGKSVMIQMLIAPFVQKSYRDLLDRHFASYFQTAAPSFILVEWALDANAGFVLTGMMVRRNQHTDEENEQELEIINFLADYKDQCAYDIYHLPVVVEEDGRPVLQSFRECRELFSRYRKESRGHFFSYDMNVHAQSTAYFSKLREFGINNREWQSIIRTVNKEEGGLSKIFAECKDERKLVEKWFLPQIESKLNKENAIIGGMQKNCEEYFRHLYETESIFAQRDAIVRFTQDATAILDKAKTLQAAVGVKQEAELSVQSALLAMHRLQPQLESKKAALQEELESVQQDVTRLTHEQLSFRYYTENDELSLASRHLAEVRERLVDIEEAIGKETRVRVLHTCQMLQANLDQQRARYASLLKELEIAQSEAKNYNEELGRLGSLAKHALSLDIEKVHAELFALTRKKEELTQALLATANARENSEHAISEELQAKGELTAKLEGYERLEDEYIARYDVQFENTFFQTSYSYPPELFVARAKKLEEREAELLAEEKRLEALGAEIVANGFACERRIEEGQTHLRTLAIARRAREDEREALSAEIDVRTSMLQYLELPSSALFDTERLCERFALLIAERESAIASLQAREKDVEEALCALDKGFLRLPKALEEVFAELEIPVTFGFEWLRSHSDTQEYTRALLAKNAFLPYALLLERSDIAKLIEAGTGQTNGVVPLIPRDRLSLSPEECSEADYQKPSPLLLPAGDNEEASSCLFYANPGFDLLDEEQRSQRKEAYLRTKERIGEEITSRKEERAVYQQRLLTLRSQKLTEKAWKACEKDLERLIAEEESQEKALLEARDRLNALRSEREKNENAKESLRTSVRTLQEEIAQLASLQKSYAVYREQKKQLKELEKSLAEHRATLLSLREKRDSLTREQQLTDGRSKDLERRAESLTAKREQVFAAFSEAETLPEDFDGVKVLAEFEAIERTIESETKLSISHLESELASCRETLSSFTTQLSGYLSSQNITDDSWKERVITESEVEHAVAELARLDRERIQASEAVVEASGKVKVAEKLVAQALEEIAKQCDKQHPLPREELKDTNFSFLLAELAEQEKRLNKEFGALSQTSGQLTALEETYASYYTENVEVCALPPCFSWGGFDLAAMGSFIRQYIDTIRSEGEHCLVLHTDLKESIFYIFNAGEFEPIRKILPRLDLIADDVDKLVRELPIKLKIFSDMLLKLDKDISKIEEEKGILVHLLLEYLEKVHAQLALIDSNSAIKIREKSKKALRIDIPGWEEHKGIYLQKVQLFLDALRDTALAALHEGKDIHDFVPTKLTTKELYDRVIGIDEISIHLLKVESQREVMISWRDVTTNSGGEGFLSSFIVLSSLLSYMRHDETDPFASGTNEGKVLLMDNPFGKTNASHLLKPLMEVAKKNNLQLICLTGLGGDSIYDRFDNIYVLNLVPAGDGNLHFVKSTKEKGANISVLSLSHLEVRDQNSLLQLFFDDDIELNTGSEELP